MEFSVDLKPFQCAICNLGFKKKQFLERHMTSHSSSRDFSCQFCQKTYKYKKGLNRHIKKIHNFNLPETRKIYKKKFKVEDYLNLDEDPKPIEISAKKEIIFTWRRRGANLD